MGPRKISKCFASQGNTKVVAKLLPYCIAKYYQLPFLGTLDIYGNFHQKWFVGTLMLICIQKSTPSLTSFLRYCKDVANLLLWDLRKCFSKPIINDSVTLKKNLMPKGLKSACSKCLSAWKKTTSPLTSFLRYCKDIAKFNHGHNILRLFDT